MPPISVFVGPNNSGKSKVLSEIHQFCINGRPNPADVILDHLDFAAASATAAEEMVQRVATTPHRNEPVMPNHVIVGKIRRLQVNRQQLLDVLMNANSRNSEFAQLYLAHNTLILNGQNRIQLINQQGAGDLQLQPATSFQTLFRDDGLRAEVRRILHEAFNEYFVIDPCGPRKFCAIVTRASFPTNIHGGHRRARLCAGPHGHLVTGGVPRCPVVAA